MIANRNKGAPIQQMKMFSGTWQIVCNQVPNYRMIIYIYIYQTLLSKVTYSN